MKDGWSVKKLGEVCSFIRGLTYTKSDEIEFSHNCVLRSNNIDLDTKTLIFDDLKYVRDDLKIGTDKFVVPNSILICMSNGSKQHIGKVAFIDKDYGYAFGGFMGLIIPINVNSKYVYYSCLSSSYKSFLENIGNGANITNLKFVDLGQFQIPIPPLPEQFRIVEELDQLSNIIEKKRQQLSELDNLAQSIFYDMFGDPDNSIYEIVKLSEIAKCKMSYGSGASAIQYDGNIRYVRITDIKEDGTLSDEKMSPNVVDDKYMLYEGDILFARSGATVGKTYLYNNKDGKSIYAGYLIRFVADTNIVIPKYIYYYTRTTYYKAFIAASAQAVAQPNINAQQFGNLKVCIPPLELQQLFAQKIEAIEKEKELIKQSIKETEELFNSRMDYYFN